MHNIWGKQIVDQFILTYAGFEPLAKHFYLHHSGT